MKPLHNKVEKPVCPVCGGSGWESYIEDASGVYGPGIETNHEFVRPCTACKGGLLDHVEHIINSAETPPDFRETTYNDFNWNKYRDENGKTVDTSQIQRFVKDFIQNFELWESENGLGFYIWSHTMGTGKTMLASIICNELIRRHGIGAKFVRTNELINISQRATNDSKHGIFKDPIQKLCDCQLLVLDDMGQNRSGKDWTNDLLYRILDNRMTAHRVTIITSNYSLEELQIDDKTVERLSACVEPIRMPEYCVRAEKSNKQKRAFYESRGLI